MPRAHKSASSPSPRRNVSPRPRPGELQRFYRTLHDTWGPQNWWPAESPFEMVVGAFLTQNTAWTNVEKALLNLRDANALNLVAFRDIEVRDLEQLIRPAGYFRQKSVRLKLFVQFLDENYAGSLERMFAEPTEKLRSELLALPGVGPETADSILLYAGNHAVFVVDAYTRRIVERHGILRPGEPYEEIRRVFERELAPFSETQALPADRPAGKPKPAWKATHSPSTLSSAPRPPTAQVFNEMHALIVETGKNYCRKSDPLCEKCPLGRFLYPS